MRDMDASTQMKRDKKNPILNIGFPAKTHHLQEGQTFTEFGLLASRFQVGFVGQLPNWMAFVAGFFLKK